MENNHIIGEIKCLNNLIKRKLDSDKTFVEHIQINGTHGYIIGYVYNQNLQGKNVYQKDIEKKFLIRRSTATELLNNMEKKGLIERKVDSVDKRLKLIELKSKAISSHKVIAQHLDNLDKELKSCFTEQEFQQFFALINKLREKLE